MLESVRALLEGVIDYAGLFPPAELGMAEAVAGYARYAASPDAWMLGRFIVPASRLSEFETALRSQPAPEKWRVSALVGPDLLASTSAVLAFNAHVREAVIDCLETRAASPAAVRDNAAAIPDGFTTYFEISADSDPAAFLDAIAAVKCRAKIRTGGVKENMIPSVEQLALFVRACDRAKVPFKATAGLHHAVRGAHAVTDEPGAATGAMHGFLNVLVASALLWTGISKDEMRTLLEDTNPEFAFTRKGVSWAQHWVSTEQIRAARQSLAIGFGSCSFEEPLADLRSRGLV